jgi:hypothetical protein
MIIDDRRSSSSQAYMLTCLHKVWDPARIRFEGAQAKKTAQEMIFDFQAATPMKIQPFGFRWFRKKMASIQIC